VPLTISVEVRDKNGALLRELPQFPLSFVAELKDAKGTTYDLKMERSGSDGQYVTTAVPDGLGVGSYKLLVDISATASDIRCEKSSYPQVIRTVVSREFPVDIYAPGLQVTSPAGQFYHYAPADEIVVHFTNQQGGVVPVPPAVPWKMEAKLLSPSGASIPTLAPIWYNGGYRIPGPFVLAEAGTYTVTLGGRSAAGTLFYQGTATFQVTDNLALIHPRPNHPALAPVKRIEVELRDAANRAVTGSPAYPLRMEAILVYPDGKTSTPIDLFPTTSAGRYQGSAKDDWTLTEPKPHQLRITGLVQAGVGAREQETFKVDLPINVLGNLPYYRVINPNEEKDARANLFYLHQLPLFWQPVPMPIRAELLEWSEQGPERRPAKDFFRGDGRNLLVVTVTGKGGKTIVDRVPLKEAPEGGLFTAKIPEIDEPGIYTATIHLSGILLDGTNYEGVLVDTVIPFKREEPLWFIVGRVVAQIIAALMVLAIISWIVWQLVVVFSKSPKPGARLVVVEAGAPSNELHAFTITARRFHPSMVPIGPVWLPSLVNGGIQVFSGRQIPASLKLRRIAVSRATKPGRQRGGGTDEEGVEIIAISQDGKEVARGRTFGSTSGLAVGGASQPVSCIQPDTDGKRYQFRFKL
jgi:hypothetical protein